MLNRFCPFLIDFPLEQIPYVGKLRLEPRELSEDILSLETNSKAELWTSKFLKSCLTAVVVPQHIIGPQGSRLAVSQHISRPQSV